jgi:hypothetical protein
MRSTFSHDNAQETITNKVPYFGMGEIAVLTAIAVRKDIPSRPEEHIPSDSDHGDMMWSLLTRCWAQVPGDRPSAGDVAKIVGPFIRRGSAPHADVLET